VANRVNVNINVNDNSRAALRQLRQSMRQTQRDVRRAGGTIAFNVTIPSGATRREIRRIQRALRRQNVTITTTLNPPTPNPRTLRRRIIAGLGRTITLPVRLTARGMLATVRGPLRALRGLVSGTLNDGIGQGILNGFKAGGPIGIAFLAAALTAAISVIGAALAGLLVLAFGGAFVAIAVIAATQFGMITKAWQKEKDRLEPLFREAVQPIVPVIEHAIELLGELGDAFAPAFKEFLAGAAPQLDSFLDVLKGSITRFGEGAWEPMTNAFNVFLDAFGPQWDGFMKDLGESFGTLGRTVSSHSTEIAMALRAVLQIIVFIIDTINFLANTWVQGIRIMTYATGLFLKGLALMVDGIMGAVETVLSALGPVAKALGMGDAIQAAREAIAVWKENTSEGLRAAGQSAMDFGKTLDKANRVRQLKVDIASFTNKLAVARADLKKTADKKARAKIQANIDDLNAKIKTARQKLDALNGKTATTYVDVWTRNKNYGGNSVTGAKRHGGVVGAAATGGVRSNLTMVGEGGPELVDLPTGSRVRSNPDTRRMMSGSGAGAPTAVIEIRSGGSKMDDMLMEIFRKAVHVRGGNVQIAVMGK